MAELNVSRPCPRRSCRWRIGRRKSETWEHRRGVELVEGEAQWDRRVVEEAGGGCWGWEIYTDLLCGWERDVEQTGNHHGWRPGALSKGAKVSPAKGDGETPCPSCPCPRWPHPSHEARCGRCIFSAFAEPTPSPPPRRSLASAGLLPDGPQCGQCVIPQPRPRCDGSGSEGECREAKLPPWPMGGRCPKG